MSSRPNIESNLQLKSAAILVVLATVPFAFGQGKNSASRGESSLPNMSQTYIENKGQWDPRVQFLAETRNMNLWLTRDGAVFDLRRTEPNGPEGTYGRPRHGLPTGKTVGDVLRLRLEHAAPITAAGLNPLPGRYNYFIGDDARKWVRGARSFSAVRTSEIYKGIALRYYFDKGRPRYDFVVSPGADPSQIAMKFDGAKSVQIDRKGNLEVYTNHGGLEERGLLAYQNFGQRRSVVACRVTVEGGLARFRIGPYNSGSELVIDPLLFSTFVFQSQINPLSLAVDSQSNVIFAGTIVANQSFPTTTGSYQTSFAGRALAFVGKLSADGSTLLSGSFLGGQDSYFGGGDGQTAPCGVALDSSGNIVVCGTTTAVDFPTTANSYEPASPPALFSGEDDYDGFVTKFNSDASSLIYSTYFGTGTEGIYSFAVDPSGSVLMAGAEAGQTFPTTIGAYDTSWQPYDGFLSKLSADGRSIVFSSLLPEAAAPTNVAFDASGNPMVCGFTAYTYAFPTTKNALFQSGEGFIASFSAGGTELLAATDLPTSSFQNAVFQPTVVGAPEPGGGFVVAFSPLTNRPATTLGAFQPVQRDYESCYIAVLSSDCTKLMNATYLGGSRISVLPGSEAGQEYDEPLDFPLALAVNKQGDVVVSGATQCADFPRTANGFMPQFPAANVNPYTLRAGFLTELSPSLSSILYSTFLGTEWGVPAPSGESGTVFGQLFRFPPVILDKYGYAYVAGDAEAPDFPVTKGAFMTNLQNSTYGTDFIMKLALTSSFLLTPSPAVVQGGSSAICTISLSAVAPSGGLVVPISTYVRSNDLTLTAPSSVMIAAGAKTATFQVQTNIPSKLSEGLVAVEVGGQYQSALLTVLAPNLASAKLTPSVFPGGASFTVTATLTGPTGPKGASLWTSLSSTAISIPAGETSTSVSFTSGSVTVTGTGHVSVAVGATSAVLPLTVTAGSAPLSIGLKNSSLSSGGSTIGTVTLDAPAGSSGLIVFLSGSNKSAVKMPSYITIPAGASSGTFTLTAQGVATTTQTIITAKANGTAPQAVLKISP